MKRQSTQGRAATAALVAQPAAAQDAPPAPPPVLRKVNYVLDRPYCAGEPPEVVEARVVRTDEGDRLDLQIRGRDGRRVSKLNVPRSDRREPGTWFEVNN